MEVIRPNEDRSPVIDFRRLLRDELIRRCDKNKGYSLRAFARHLGVNHATLSSIIAGKRALTRDTIIKFGKSLNLKEEQLEEYLARHKSKSTETAFTEHQHLALEAFTAISEWYHDAILELTHTKNFNPDIRWISIRLGISTTEVRSAVERLVRLDLLKITEKKWTDLSRNNTTNITNTLTSAALVKLQGKILELSAKALDELSRAQRDHTSITVAMQSNDLDEIKERIKKFRFELVNFIERKDARPDAVYQFAFSVFPLTKKPK